MRQLSKQHSIQEPDEEMPKQKAVLIQEEKAEIGMVQIVCVCMCVFILLVKLQQCTQFPILINAVVGAAHLRPH